MDQLTNEELHLIVGHIDKKQKIDHDQAAEDKKDKTEEKEGEAEGKPEAESKEARRKRLHARNMRYYRSLESRLS